MSKIKQEEKEVEVKGERKEKYFFPGEKPVTIEATSMEEAVKIYEKNNKEEK